MFTFLRTSGQGWIIIILNNLNYGKLRRYCVNLLFFQQLRVRAPNLKLHVTKSTAGRYICKANVDGYPEIEAEATVFIKSKCQFLFNYRRARFSSYGEICWLYVTNPDLRNPNL